MVPSAEEGTNIVSESCIRGKRLYSSPTLSPTPKQLDKRRRTLKQTYTQSVEVSRIPTIFENEISAGYMYDSSVIQNFTVNSFKMDTEESVQLESIRSGVLKYIVLKQLHESKITIMGKKAFPSLVQFITCTNYI